MQNLSRLILFSLFFYISNICAQVSNVEGIEPMEGVVIEIVRLEQEAKEAEDQRQQQLRRLKSLGATTTEPVDPVNEYKGGGKPSDSYLRRLRARVKPNITFSDSQLQSIRGNPAAEVEVIVHTTGKIIGMKLTQSSGNSDWDQAVLKAIEKAAYLPRDENGKIPSKIPFVFRPRE